MFDSERFDELLKPKSVAIIGASRTRRFYWVRSFLEYDFPGEIFPVNPKEKEVLGLKCYPRYFRCPSRGGFCYNCCPSSNCSKGSGRLR